MLYPTELRAHVIVNKQLPLIQKRWLTPNYILLYYTSRMVAQNGQAEDGDQETTWQPTHCANIVRHIPSEIYYARLRIKGKLIWRNWSGLSPSDGEREALRHAPLLPFS